MSLAVTMPTVISSHVKDMISSTVVDIMFSTLKKTWYFIDIYIIIYHSLCPNYRTEDQKGRTKVSWRKYSKNMEKNNEKSKT